MDVESSSTPEPARLPDIPARYLVPVVRCLRELGVPPEPLLQQAGLTPEQVQDPDRQIPLQSLQKFILRAVEVSGDPHLGLRAGILSQDIPMGLPLYLINSCVTFREAVLAHNHCSAMFSEHRWFVQVEGEVVRWGFRPILKTATSHHMAEGHLAAIVSWCRKERAEWTPNRVVFAHSRPDDVSTLQEVFDCPLVFDADCNAVEFPAAHMDYPRRLTEPAMHDVLTEYAELRVGARGSLTYKIRSVLTKELAKGAPSQEEVAARLNVSVSTLSRRLRDEGITYREVVDGLRRDLAIRYVLEGCDAASELAYRLGFTHTNSFYRWFKRWDGRRFLPDLKARAVNADIS